MRKEKGWCFLDVIVVIAIILVLCGLLVYAIGIENNKRIAKFQEIYGVDLTPHLNFFGEFEGGDAREILQAIVTIKLSELWARKYEVVQERERIKAMVPDGSDWTSAELKKKLEELIRIEGELAIARSPYDAARESAVWWFEVTFAETAAGH